MRRIFILMVMIACAFSSEAQFRKSRERIGGSTTTQPGSVTEATINYANPAEYYIAGIEISGLNVLDKNAMISLTGLKVGDKVKIPGDQIATAIRKLW